MMTAQSQITTMAASDQELYHYCFYQLMVRLWDTDTGACRQVLTRHTGRLRATAFDPTGGLLATAGDDLVIRLWDLRRL